MILETLWCPIFTPSVIPLGGVKMGHETNTPGVPGFYTKLWGKNRASLKVILLISKSH